MKSLKAPVRPATQHSRWVVPVLVDNSLPAPGDTVHLLYKGNSWGRLRVCRVIQKPFTEISYRDLAGFVEPTTDGIRSSLNQYYRREILPESLIAFIHLDTDWEEDADYEDDSASFERSSLHRSRFRPE